MKQIVLLVLSGFLLSTTYSQTAVVKESYTVTGGLLGAANISNFRTDKDVSPRVDYKGKLNWGIGAWVNFPITNGFSIEPQLQYNSLQYQTRSTEADLLLYDGKIRYISLPILLKLHAGNNFAFTLGPQFDFMTSIEDNRNVANKDEFKGSAVSLSGGLEIFPHGRVTVFGRYVHGFSNVDDRVNHGTDTREYKTSNVQLGLKFRLFGHKKTETVYQATSTPAPLDSDGDGITDDMDKCPNQAGLAKYNGCPIPDSDGDGINDEEDKCPNQAGIAKYNGCPIPDSDGDGINDEEDKCPNQAGTAKYNGCPVPDRDNDGINDEEDKCPDIAGVSANNGCPEVPANVSKSLGVAATKVKFTGTSITLNSASNAALDQVVTLMNENPGMSIRVEAHTDNATNGGDDDKNMKMTQDRANAVKDYIVSKGIADSRVTAEGFGETMPIADNTTAAGRTKNRRIEIKLNY